MLTTSVNGKREGFKKKCSVIKFKIFIFKESFTY